MYNDKCEALWDSMTNHHGGESMWLACQNDNNVVLHGDNTYY